ncbi:potassium-transporting ATPase subunit KdpC [Rhizobium paknamense]|uniref:Potassium-transporting ATPase KdpC subunit n=1 Tax=Rhizobium paknamense TaxID=1206817 RepID=A0ABU0IC53_9HYPH|nr:potassium-transporting ATPase subunit KdpC [Rhizobium paknamense]MDQ0455806.1 K+-transporting ATPase ATPase C chain [Rhizobium paknamense]
MLHHLRPAFTLVLLMTVLTGLGYPYAVTGIAETLMPAKANGSLIEKDGKVIGSSLIGQNFTSDRYFWPRPSVTQPDAYNAANSVGSNLGATSKALHDRVAGTIDKLKASGITGPVPADAATASGSGLDPHISPAFAGAQISRVAKARNVPEADVQTLVAEHLEKPALGFFGEPRVNVLELNLALDTLQK